MDDTHSYRDIQREKFLQNLRKYCDYQERCHYDVELKLKKLGADADLSDEIVTTLILEGYLNEERYARSYARGKFRISKWGKNKIIMGLKAKKISSYLIQKSLEEIDDDDYIALLKEILVNKSKYLSYKNKYDKHSKLYTYAYNRGFEGAIIKELLETFE